MNREEFIDLLEKEGCKFYTEGNSIVIFDNDLSYNHTIYLDCEYIPDNVTFKNKGPVRLENLRKLPPNTKFLNSGDVSLGMEMTVEDVPETVVFGEGVTDVGEINEMIKDTNIPGINFIRMFRHLHNKGLIPDFPGNFPS